MDFSALLKKSNTFHMCTAITFFISGLIISTVQGVLYFCLKPFNKDLFRRINYYLCYSFFDQMVFIADWWSNSKLYIFCDEDIRKNYLGKEHALLMMNHTYDVDWLIGWMLCEKVGVLGNCKAFVKKVLQYIPAIGWSWKFAECVFLERSFDKDKEIIERQISEILDYPDPVWLLIYVEGTRFTESKHEASVKFAKERGMPILKHHLIPRTKGFTTSLPVLKKKCPAILDIQLAFKIEPTFMNLLSGRGITGHMHIRRIDMKTIPDNESEASEWVQDMYRFKDKIQDSFHTHGDFFTGSGLSPIKPVLLKRNTRTVINTMFWAIATLSLFLYFLIGLLFSGKLLQTFIGISIIAVFHILMQKTIDMSKISKGSSYGANSKQNNH